MNVVYNIIVNIDGLTSEFVLDLGLDGVDRVHGVDLERDGLTSEGLDKNLHASSGRQPPRPGRQPPHRKVPHWHKDFLLLNHSC